MICLALCSHDCRQTAALPCAMQEMVAEMAGAGAEAAGAASEVGGATGAVAEGGEVAGQPRGRSLRCITDDRSVSNKCKLRGRSWPTKEIEAAFLMRH